MSTSTHVNGILHGLSTPFSVRDRDDRLLQQAERDRRADGVGRATTVAVVIASIAVIMSDFFLTKLFVLLPLGLS